eukprot:1149064-Pelagomonas_calceolata.AAC.5
MLGFAQHVEPRSLALFAAAMWSRTLLLDFMLQGPVCLWCMFFLRQAQGSGLAMVFSLHGSPSAVAAQNTCSKRHAECAQQPSCRRHTANTCSNAALTMHPRLHAHHNMP